MENLVNSILRKHWNLSAPIKADDTGASRMTWQVGKDHWITRTNISDVDQFKSETKLISRLSNELQLKKTPFKTLETITSMENLEIVIDQGYAWRITKNIAGVKLPASDKRTYFTLIKTIFDLHKAFGEISISEATIKDSLVDKLNMLEKDFFKESRLLNDIMSFIKPHLKELSQNDKQITHGDFNPSNIIYSINGESIKVEAIIDLECCRPDPPIMDYAQLFIMAICHSGDKNPFKITEDILGVIGKKYSRMSLHACMMAYWIDLYLNLHHIPVAKEKVLLRLSQLWSFHTKYGS
ncbi:MAG: phosphotransferase [Halobacteriovoraceae bacterium]|jgi:hypothetical protein|nr:phosphotransferase [Halobacteriovoraceae bacterium]